MYLDTSLHSTLLQTLRFALSDESCRSLTAVKSAQMIAEIALRSQAGCTENSSELIIAAASKMLEIPYHLSDDDLLGAFEYAKRRYLKQEHEAMTPALDPGHRSFEVQNIMQVLNTIYRDTDSVLSDIIDDKRRNTATYFMIAPPDLNGFSIRTGLTVRYDSAPKIRDSIEISHRNEPMAQFSFAKLFSIGFWRPCPKNCTATDEELKNVFGEPIILSQILRKKMSQLQQGSS